MAAAYKLEELPRTQRGYGFKARVPGKGSPTFRAPTKSDAKAKAMRWVDDVLSGRERTSPEITLSEYRAEIAPAAPWGQDARRNNDSLWKLHVGPRFADDPLSTIGRPQIRTWIVELEKQGVGQATRHHALIHLKFLLNAAKRDGRIASVPDTTGLVRQPDKREGYALTPDQVMTLAEALPKQYGTIVLLGATTGLRIGELLALRPEDIDEQHMVITVRRSVKGSGDLKDRRTVGDPKTPSAKRDVPITRSHVNLVRDHIDQFGLSIEGYLFTSMVGRSNWLTYLAFRQVFGRAVKRLVKEIDFPPIRTHDLRKTFGAHLVANADVPMQEKHKIMGHKQLSTLLDIYAPHLPGSKALPAHQATMAKRFELPGADEPEMAIEPWTPPDAPRYFVATKICPVDGVKFVPAHGRKVTCSPRCSRARRTAQSRVRTQRLRDSRIRADLGLVAMGVVSAPSKNGATAVAAVERWSDPIEYARWNG